MKHTSVLIQELEQGSYSEKFAELYVGESERKRQRGRYIAAIKNYVNIFGDDEVEIYSAPGRSEIGGNHTDHQCGKVLATSVNIDTIAVTSKRDDDVICIKSEGYDKVEIDLKHVEKSAQEEGTTIALNKGVVAGFKERGFAVGGFQAYVTSEVLSGSGLSSSAAYEVLLGTILSYLYNDKTVDAQTIAKIGQYAENVYFGKPCGLMDQMACSVGGIIYVDFKNPSEPEVQRLDVEFEKYNYSLCITDTKGSHADLTDEYAAIPDEMKKIADVYGADVLRQVDREFFFRDITKLRERCGDRAVLRAIHWFEENDRVEKEMDALREDDFDKFQAAVKASGDSSAKYLQNIYSTKKLDEQNITIALAISDILLSGKGVSRVHGGGFAGTIQAFVPDACVETYKAGMDKIFRENACKVLKARKTGGTKVV